MGSLYYFVRDFDLAPIVSMRHSSLLELLHLGKAQTNKQQHL